MNAESVSQSRLVSPGTVGCLVWWPLAGNATGTLREPRCHKHSLSRSFSFPVWACGKARSFPERQAPSPAPRCLSCCFCICENRVIAKLETATHCGPQSASELRGTARVGHELQEGQVHQLCLCEKPRGVLCDEFFRETIK